MYPVTPLLLIIVTCCLIVTCVYFFSTTNDTFKQKPTNKVQLIRLTKVLLVIAFCIYAYLVFGQIFASKEGIKINSGLAFAIVGLIYISTALIYQFSPTLQKTTGINRVIGILTSLALLSSLGLVSTRSAFYLSETGLALYSHLFLSLSAYALLSLALVFAALQLHHSNNLRKIATQQQQQQLPSLEFLEKQSFFWLTLGFALLTVALLTGFFFLYDLRGQNLPHKVVLSIVSWLIFATLLCGRYFFGWRGKQAMRWVLAGFISLALAYFGSKFILEVLLHRSW